MMKEKEKKLRYLQVEVFLTLIKGFFWGSLTMGSFIIGGAWVIVTISSYRDQMMPMDWILMCAIIILISRPYVDKASVRLTFLKSNIEKLKSS